MATSDACATMKISGKDFSPLLIQQPFGRGNPNSFPRLTQPNSPRCASTCQRVIDEANNGRQVIYARLAGRAA